MQPTNLPRSATYAPASSSQTQQRERFTRIENRNRQEAAKDDSWIEVSSQPSDDSYSTSSSEIILEGLVVQSAVGAQQRIRKKRKGPGNNISSGHPAQDKVYDKDADDLSEAEILNPGLSSGDSSGPASSIEQLPRQEDYESSSSAAEEESDSSSDEAVGDSDTGAGTLLGTGYRTGPKPNLYATQSPHNLQQTTTSRPPATTNYYPHPRSPVAGGFVGSTGRYSRSPPTKKDHDEALMASLSTLLSCAAAARALPKAVGARQVAGPSSSRQSNAATMASSRVQLDTLQLVPDRRMSENGSPAIGVAIEHGKPATSRRGSVTRTGAATSAASQQSPTTPPLSRGKSSTLSPAASDTENTRKRRSPGTKSPSSRRSQSPRSARKSSLIPLPLDESMNVSFLTVAVGAGVVVVLSAVAFSAGYALGKEVGKSEADVVGEALGNATRGVIREGARGSGRGLVGGVGRRVVSVAA